MKWVGALLADRAVVPQVPGRREADVLQVAVGDDPPPALPEEERVVVAVDGVDGVDAGEAVAGLDRREEHRLGGGYRAASPAPRSGTSSVRSSQLVGRQRQRPQPVEQVPLADLELRACAAGSTVSRNAARSPRFEGVDPLGRAPAWTASSRVGVAVCRLGPTPGAARRRRRAAPPRRPAPPGALTPAAGPHGQVDADQVGQLEERRRRLRGGRRRRGWRWPGRRGRRGPGGRRGRRRGRPAPRRRTGGGRRRPGSRGRRRSPARGQQAAQQGLALVEVGVEPLEAGPVVVAEQRQPDGPGVGHLEQVAHEDQVAQRLAHLLAVVGDHRRVHPVPGQGLAGDRRALGDLALVVGEDQVGAAAVEVEGGAVGGQHHGRAFDVPARPAGAEGGVPGRLVGGRRCQSVKSSGSRLAGSSGRPPRSAAMRSISSRL